MNLLQLCEKLHPERVSAINISDLKSEIEEATEDSKKSLLYCLINKIIITNKSNSQLIYCLGISDTRPIASVHRVGRSSPDIDLDLPEDKRDEVIAYVIEKYGKDKVAHIGTYGQMRAAAAVRATARTLSCPEVGIRLSKLLLKPIHGKPQSIATSIEKIPELKELAKNRGQEAKVLEWAQKIENLFSSAGVHASGIIISTDSLWDTVPLFLGKSKELTTQWDMNRIEDIGLVKFDFLGLKTLTKMRTCLDLVKERHNIKIDIENISTEDNKVFEELRAGNTQGIFQLESSSGIRDLLINIRPVSLEDITALIAIFRPGPLESDYLSTYLNIRAGREEVKYLVPELEPILKSTSGFLIYQEQALRIASELCGMSKAEADLLRRAIGKKKEKEIALYEKKFLDGWETKGLEKEVGKKVWEAIKSFADYAFNHSHAAAYALIAYQTAWLKTYYPIEFMCANLICDKDNTEQIIKYISECRRLKIKVLPPHINLSGSSFTIEGDNIRFGLGPIKNLGTKPVEHIILERKESGEFKDFYDFCKRVNLSEINRKKIESLILSGAFDSLGFNRQSTLNAVENYWSWKKDTKSFNLKNITLSKKMESYRSRETEIELAKNRGDSKIPKSFKLPITPISPMLQPIIQVSEMPSNLIEGYEHELLGFFVSSHPLDPYLENIDSKEFPSISETKSLIEKSKVKIVAVITGISRITTKKKQNMAFLDLEDKTGTMEGVVFPKEFLKYESCLVKGAVLIFSGTISITEGEEETVAKIIIETISSLKQGGISEAKERIQTSIEISSLKLRDKLNGINSFLGRQEKLNISIRLADKTIIKPKHPVLVKNTEEIIKYLNE